MSVFLLRILFGFLWVFVYGICIGALFGVRLGLAGRYPEKHDGLVYDMNDNDLNNSDDLM